MADLAETKKLLLYRCPFCGRDALLRSRIEDYYYDEEYYIECSGCGAEYYDFGSTKEQIIEQWNRRQPLTNVITALKKEIEESDKLHLDEFGCGLKVAVKLLEKIT